MPLFVFAAQPRPFNLAAVKKKRQVVNAFYICGLEAKYAEEFNRNTRRLSRKGESSEVWPISKNWEAPHSDLCAALWCEAELKTGGDCARGQSYLGQAPLWRVAKLKTGGRVSCMDSLWHEARLKTEDMSHTHCGLLAETFFPSPGARLSLIFRVRFGHSGQFVTCLMDYLLVSTIPDICHFFYTSKIFGE